MRISFFHGFLFFLILNSIMSAFYRLVYHKLTNKIIWMASGTKDETVPLDFSKKLKDLYPTCQNIVFNQYSTGHESTKEMIQDTMSFLSNNFPNNQKIK